MSTNDKNEKDYLKDLAPNLFRKDLEKERKVPEGYFENVEDEVFAKIRRGHTEVPEAKWRRLINYRNLAVAAGFAAIVVFGPFLWKALNAPDSELQPDEPVSWESIDREEASLYLAEQSGVEDWLYSEINEDDLEEISLRDEDLSDEDIIDYLLESDLSEKMILESL